MPKDPARNQPNYKIGGGQLNEFEFAHNQGAMTEAEHERFLQQQAEGETAPPQTEAARIQQLMADVHEQVQRRKAKAQPPTKKGAAKKQATRAATKGAAKKVATKKGAAKKSAAKKGAAKKGAAKRAGARKGASKKGARKAAR